MTRFFLISLILCSFLAAKQPNVLFICVDDLRPELKSLGADYIHSPAMDSLVKSGRAFTRHYVQAPTCGASRYALLSGKYAIKKEFRDNEALMQASQESETKIDYLPRQFKKNGYQTVSVGKVSHYPGGLGGKDWNDPSVVEMPGSWDISLMPTGPWKNPQNAMHGYADGQPRERGKTPAKEHKEGDDFTYSDGWIAREALKQMDELAGKNQPFFLAVGLMKPHLPFACPKSYWDLYDGAKIPAILHPEKPKGISTWHSSDELLSSYSNGGKNPNQEADYAMELKRSYAACVSYADAQVAKLLSHLDELGLAENTIVVLWGDHGWHLGEHGVWGKHTLFEEALLAPLIIRVPGMKEAGKSTDAIVETIDIFPTLCELTGISAPMDLSGNSLVKHLEDPSAKGTEAISYWRAAETVRTPQYRLIRHNRNNKSAEYELYDHGNNNGEMTNLAEEKPDLVRELSKLIDQKLK